MTIRTAKAVILLIVGGCAPWPVSSSRNTGNTGKPSSSALHFGGKKTQ